MVPVGSVTEAGLVVEVAVEPVVVVVAVAGLASVVAVAGERNWVGLSEVYLDFQATAAESAVVELANSNNLGTAEAAGIVNQAPKQHLAAVAGIRRVLAEVKDLVGFAVGMDRQVVAEGRCLLVVHYTIQVRILVVAAGGEVVGGNRCTQVVRNRAGSNRMLEGH